MLKKRVIPCLDIKDGKVVKGINFVNLVNVGDPAEIAAEYERQCADEIVFLDISATGENRETTCAIIAKAASSLSIPLTAGGGVRTIDDFRKILACGADKVSINSAAVRNPALISTAAKEFGSQCVVVAIDGRRVDGEFHVFVEGGRVDTGIELVEWARKCEADGAGEILLTSMDADGVQNGFDIQMTRAVTGAVNIPVIASGGCGSVGDIADVFKRTGCSGALAASLFHFGKATVGDVKAEMNRRNIPCRIIK